MDENGNAPRRTPGDPEGKTSEGIWTAPAPRGAPLTTPPGRADAPSPEPEAERGPLPLTPETSDPSLMVSKQEDPRADEGRQQKYLEAWRKARVSRR